MTDFTETVYEHVSGNKTFTVTAAERWSKTMIKRLKERYPDEVEITAENNDGSLVAHIPTDWMRIVPKRHVTMSDEQKKELTERLIAARNNSSTAE